MNASPIFHFYIRVINFIEHNPWETHSHSICLEVFFYGPLSFLQEPVNGTYPVPVESSSKIAICYTEMYK